MNHDWVDDGVDIHKGEYWYRCSVCGASDWIASYGTKDQLMPKQCPGPRTDKRARVQEDKS